MESHRGGDNDGIKRGIGAHLLVIGLRLDPGVETLEVAQAIFAYITNSLHGAIRERAKITHQIRTPIATADNAYVEVFFHMVVYQLTDSLDELKKVTGFGMKHVAGSSTWWVSSAEIPLFPG